MFLKLAPKRLHTPLLILFTLAVFIFAGSYRSESAPVNFYFMPVFLAVCVLCDIIITTIAFSHSRAFNNRQTYAIGGAYLASAILAAFIIADYPTALAVGATFNYDSNSIWLWFLLEISAPICAAILISLPQSLSLRRTVAFVLLGCLLASFIGPLISRFIPLLTETCNHYHCELTIRSGLVYISGLVNFLCLSFLWFKLKNKGLIEQCFLFTLFLLVLDDAFSLSWQARYTVGWYTWKIMIMLLKLAMLMIVLLRMMDDYKLIDENNRRHYRQSITDDLTGLHNRRYFAQNTPALWEENKASGQHIGLIMLDVDKFKKYNDHYGHLAGDRCLAKIGHALDLSGNRDGNLVARMGGEEFAMFIPSTDKQQLAQVCERIRLAIAELKIPHVGNPEGDHYVSMSIGAVLVDPSQTALDISGTMNLADKMLYLAKKQGRNQSKTISESEFTPQMSEQL